MENENLPKLSDLVELSVKMRPSQKAILKVIEHSIQNGEIDSAVDLVKKLGHNLKDDEKNKFHKILSYNSPLRPYLEKAFLISKTDFKEHIYITPDSKSNLINIEHGKVIKEEQKDREEFEIPIDGDTKDDKKLKGDTIQTEGEVIQLGYESEEPVLKDDKKITNLDDKDDYNSLGIDLVPESEKSKIKQPEDLTSKITDKDKTVEEAEQIHIDDAKIEVDNLSLQGEIPASDNEAYNSLGVDLLPDSDKGDVLSFLDKLKKEINSFPGSDFLKQSPFSQGGSRQPFEKGKISEDPGESIVTDEDIENILNSGSGTSDSVFHIEEPSGGSQYGLGGQPPPMNMGERSVHDPAIQSLLQAQAIASQGNMIQREFSGDPVSNVSTPGKVQFEYTPMPFSGGSELLDSSTMSPLTSPHAKDDLLGNALKDALKNALTDAIEGIADSFKDENKDLFDKVEKSKITPEIKTPTIEMPKFEDKEEEDDSKDWVRDVEDTKFKVQSFDEKDDESVGKYDNFEDDEEGSATPFTDINKTLFDDVEKEPKTISKKLEDFDTEEDLNVEHKKNVSGSREIVVTNMNQEKKRRKPPKKLPKRVRLSFSFRNLFNNKAYIKYKEILNRAAILVAEKRLDEALDYYYTIRDQNIPNVFKMMVQQNIDDIEETIMNTFQFSDTIVKLKDSGRAIRLRDINEFEKQVKQKEKEARALKKGEVYFNDESSIDDYDDDYEYDDEAFED